MDYPKRILMRACCSPKENYSTLEVIKNNYIWNNIGNMLFPYSLFKILSCKGAEIDAYRDISSKDADYINKNYDCFVIPLANAFRDTFMNELSILTDLIKKLEIPCVCIGVGLQAPVQPDSTTKYPFDEEVKEFCSELLKRSTTIGVRGAITKRYLMNLGIDDSRIDVIGFPSMYMNGREIKIDKKGKLHTDSVICMNAHSGVPIEILQSFNDIRNRFHNNYFIPQEMHELKLVYAGVPFENVPEEYMSKPTDKIYIDGNCRMFTSVPSWLEFLSNADFSIGCRIHGNIAAILAGVPTLVLAPDSRVEELAEFHGIPYMLAKDYTTKMSIEELYKNLDFEKLYEVQPKNFDNFINFLNKNKIDHIYNYDGVSTFDEIIKNTKFNPPVKPISLLNSEEIARRLNDYNLWMYKRENWFRNKIKQEEKLKEQEIIKYKNELEQQEKLKEKEIIKYKNELEQQEKLKEKEITKHKNKVKKQEKILNYKSVKIAIKVHNTAVKIKKIIRRKN